MSPSDCTMRSASGTAVAATSTAADHALALGAAGASCAVGAGSAIANQRDQAAPRTADSTASGTPNSATALHDAPRMEAAAIGTGETSASPWLADSARASAPTAPPRRCGDAVSPAMAHRSGVSSAKAVAGEAASPATRPHSVDKAVGPPRRRDLAEEPILAASQGVPPVASAIAATKLAATITSPGVAIACAKPAPNALPTKAVEKPAARPKIVAIATMARKA